MIISRSKFIYLYHNVLTWSTTARNFPLVQVRLSLLLPVSPPSLVSTVVESWYLKLPWQYKSRGSPSLNVRYLTPSADSEEGKTKLLFCVSNGGYFPVNWSRFTVQLSPDPLVPKITKDELRWKGKTWVKQRSGHHNRFGKMMQNTRLLSLWASSYKDNLSLIDNTVLLYEYDWVKFLQGWKWYTLYALFYFSRVLVHW